MDESIVTLENVVKTIASLFHIDTSISLSVVGENGNKIPLASPVQLQQVLQQHKSKNSPPPLRILVHKNSEKSVKQPEPISVQQEGVN